MIKDVDKKQSVAWFKLTEFIGRGEKERALGFLRLLTHSLTDKAFIKKLEAELLLQCYDQQAIDFYLQSAHLYQISGRTIEAATIFETLILLSVDNVGYVEKAVMFFDQLGDSNKKKQYQKILYDALLKKGVFHKSLQVFEEVKSDLDDLEQLFYHESFVLCAIKLKYPQQERVSYALKKAVDGHLRFSGDEELNSFLTIIKSLNQVWHKDALSYVKEVYSL